MRLTAVTLDDNVIDNCAGTTTTGTGNDSRAQQHAAVRFWHPRTGWRGAPQAVLDFNLLSFHAISTEALLEWASAGLLIRARLI